MSQISPPIRIVLVAVIGLLAAWMLFLRPKSEPTPAPAPAPATAPGVTGLSNSVDKAKDASATSDEANEKLQKATGEDDAAKGKSGSESGSSTALVSGRVLPLEPLGDDQTEGLPRAIVRALDNRQVFVVGILDTREKRWARMASDDRRVRRELSKANRYDGNVVVTRSTLGRLSKLNAIVGDLGVSQTPSVVVVDRNRKAVVLTGYVDRNAINQAIADARRNSIERRVKEPFVRRLNETCANYDLRVDRLNYPRTRAGYKPFLTRVERLVGSYRKGFGSLAAPARYRGVERMLVNAMRKREQALAALRANDRAKFVGAVEGIYAVDAALDRRFAAIGASTCVIDRKS